jgi:ankyrin repeat protein
MSYYKNKECINKQDINGDFALLYAVYNKNTPIIKELLDSGANANLINKHNVYPLWYAVYNNDKSSFFQLIKYCIDFETKSYGIDYQNFETIPEIIYDRPISPIALAEFKCFYDIVYYLYCVGAKVTIDLRRRIKTKLNSLNEPSTVVSANDINKLKRLDKLLNQPMKLTRICRISIRNKNKNHLNRLECVNVVPSSIKEFLTLETF